MNKDKLANLTNKMLEKLLNPDEAQELAAILAESKEAGNFYIELCETHALLEEHHGKFFLAESSKLPQTNKQESYSFLSVVT